MSPAAGADANLSAFWCRPCYSDGRSTPSPPGDLFPETSAAAGVVHINGQCAIRSRGDQRVVVAQGVPVAVYAAVDRMAEAYAMVLLVGQGLARQVEVARAFVGTARTVRRCEARFAGGGLAALARQPGWPTGRLRRQLARRPRACFGRKHTSAHFCGRFWTAPAAVAAN